MAAPARDRLTDERGSGVVGSLVGVTVFLTLLLFAVQLALNLYSTTAVSSIAFDAAREVAGSNGGSASTIEAERRARELLRRFESEGGTLDFEWNTSRDDVVLLRVVAERPSLLPNISFPFQRVARTVTVRWERAR